MAVTLNANTSTGFIATSDTSGVLQLQTGGTAAVTVNASQNVGIGVTPSASWNSGYKAIQIANASYGSLSGQTAGASTMQLSWGAYATGADTWAYLTTGDSVSQYVMNSALHRWRYAASGTAGNTISWTEAMRIDSSGNLLVGTTSSFGQPGKVCIQGATALSLKGVASGNGGDIEFIRSDTNVRSWLITANANDFYIANAGFTKYAYLSTQNFTGWTFASDRRIKKNIVDLSYGLNAVMAMQPREFDYVSNNQHDIGFIAQELQQVIPEVVSGEEVPYADEDTPKERAAKTMGVTKDALIPVLVKAIQEQQAIIQTLTDRITALEGAQP